MTDAVVDQGPVERWLDEAFDRLAGTGSAGRRALAEAEDHLRAATAEAVVGGLGLEQAERQAVERFGTPEELVGPLRAAHRVAPVPSPVRDGTLGATVRGAAIGTVMAVTAMLLAAGRPWFEVTDLLFVAGLAGLVWLCVLGLRRTPGAPDRPGLSWIGLTTGLFVLVVTWIVVFGAPYTYAAAAFADRFAYIPGPGLYLAVMVGAFVAGAGMLTARWVSRAARSRGPGRRPVS